MDYLCIWFSIVKLFGCECIRLMSYLVRRVMRFFAMFFFVPLCPLLRLMIIFTPIDQYSQWCYFFFGVSHMSAIAYNSIAGI
jgi:hypothetical protein